MHVVYGIRHHGPGSARSLLAALERDPPDALVIEAPEELAPLLDWIDHAELEPPVAALIWAGEDTRRASFYPFAVFSPEWVALRWARAHGVHVYCMDLPMRHALAIRAGIAEKADSAPDEDDTPFDKQDPIRALARAAGYEDGEAWWEHLVESQGHAAFDAISEAMQAAREAGIGRLDDETLLREAHMRQVLRAALKAGHARVAVVCGAYHAPVLEATALKSHAIKDDAARLKGLPKLKVEATWVPWASSRLGYASGYGAGIEASGWYAHLWNVATPAEIATGWLARTAQALRAEDVDAPAASVIEAVRLAQTLATMRRRPSPDLAELREASLAVLCHGERLTLELAERRLLGVSPRFDVLGRVPDALPQSPLQADFAALNRSLRLKTEALERRVELDLRQDADRAKSRHFWRLRLLGVDWAQLQDARRGKGSFRESWRLRWMPEAALALIECGRFGGTIAQAAQNRAAERLRQPSPLLADLLELADEVLKAELLDGLPPVLAALDARAAQATDVQELMAALPPLAAMLRYGDVRDTDLAALGRLMRGLLTRSCVGLPGACAQLNAEAAIALIGRLDATHTGLQTLGEAALMDEWLAALALLIDAQTTPAPIAGRSLRLLLDAQRVDAAEAQRRLRLALASASVPTDAANWLEGFLRGSVHLLLGQAGLRELIGSWLGGLSGEHFQGVLPLVRRAFSVFSVPERRLLLQEVLAGAASGATAGASAGEEDYEPEAYAQVIAGLRAWIPA